MEREKHMARFMAYKQKFAAKSMEILRNMGLLKFETHHKPKVVRHKKVATKKIARKKSK